MTPEQEALREKVARNIERAVQMQDFGHWADDGGFVCTVEQAERLAACCDDAAADAIAVVLKEAAGAIRAYSENTYGAVLSEHAELTGVILALNPSGSPAAS